MSKIGKKPIAISTAKVEVDGNRLKITGGKITFDHELPEGMNAVLEDGKLNIGIANNTRENRMLWGLHRMLVANKVQGVEKGFEQKFNIVGLGYKAQVSGSQMIFSLGYTHKINFDLPEGVTAEVDKTGQKLVFRSHDKFLLGNVCSKVRSFRPPEPYKGTGIIKEGEVILRKAGKTKA
ncbi:MAG: 50S ribosomal protein L6 [Epsilonproteobacteria bacterium]|nr:50S ribosomal protein L6 [Campylobacterota bacterium]